MSRPPADTAQYTIPVRPPRSRTVGNRVVPWPAIAVSLAVLLLAAPGFPQESAPAAPPLSAAAPEPPTDRELFDNAAVIGRVLVRPENIFDIADPREDNWLFRLANKLHYRTRPKTIERQLLVRPGDRYDRRVLDESERILRSNGYLWDARIRPVAVRDNAVDLEVVTRDVWTLRPGFSFERKGGRNTTRIDLEEANLLGRGSKLTVSSTSTPERYTDSVQYIDQHLFGRWLHAEVLLESSSDGMKHSYILERPFYALDTRWTAGGSFLENDRVDTLVGVPTIAPEYHTRIDFLRLAGGWSRGLRGGWVWRYRAGIAKDATRFTRTPGDNSALPIPADRILKYPFAGVEIVEDAFEKTKNLDQIERTEDIVLGTHVQATLGYATPTFGADRRAFPFTASLAKGARSERRWTVTFSGSAGGRVEETALRDTTLEGAGRAYYRLSPAWLVFASLSGSRMIAPDDDHQLLLGGDTGLRGYPMRYQAGDRKYLLTLEQRYFSTLFPFRLFRIGGAVFFDAGRAWGGNATDLPAKGVLRDAGVGLRIGMVRSGLGNVIHIDVAFPFDGDRSIDRRQFLVETKQSF